MTASVLDRSVVRSAPRRRLLLAAGAVVWPVLYRVNLPWWDWVVYDVAGFDETTPVGRAVHFFSYDTVKIALLLTGVFFVGTVLRSFMSVGRTRALFGVRRCDIGGRIETTPTPNAVEATGTAESDRAGR